MIRREAKFRYWTLREWECCGLLWQLLLGKNWPGRLQWNPICPACGVSYKPWA